MIANKEKCADKEKSVCEYNEFRRLRYFHGMLLDDKDFSAEQEYHVNKRRFINRMLHGSGVVCGLELGSKSNAQWIEVSSGLALDCAGNEIWVPSKIKIDLADLLPPKNKGKNQAECEEEEDKDKPKAYYIGIRYQERSSNPVSVYLPSGSCEERSCENSRYKEGYCIQTVQCCPEKPDSKKYPGLVKGFCECTEDYELPEGKELPLCPTCSGLSGKPLCECIRMEEFCEQSVPCPECGSCDNPCFVVLGKIEVDDKGRLVSLCNNECRRYVLTGRMIQHMLSGIFANGTDYFQMKVGDEMTPLPDDVGEWASNPIKALCWWLPFKLAGGEFVKLRCDYEEPEPPKWAKQLLTLESQMKTADDRIIKLAEHVKFPLPPLDRDISRSQPWAGPLTLPEAGPAVKEAQTDKTAEHVIPRDQKTTKTSKSSTKKSNGE